MIAREEDGSFARYAWPGGYPIYHICIDGGVLCPSCANDEGHTDAPDDDWRIVASDINWEDQHLTCDHCAFPIESAYAEAGHEDSD